MRVVENWLVFIAPLNKVITKMKLKVFTFFKPSEYHVNADEDIGPSPGHFDRFPSFEDF